MSMPFYFRNVRVEGDKEGFVLKFELRWWGIPLLLLHEAWKKAWKRCIRA